jgi:hypothetical protein
MLRSNALAAWAAGSAAEMAKSPGRKVQTVMHEWGKGQLHSGSPKGPKVTNQKQAVAVALSEQRKANAKRGKHRR